MRRLLLLALAAALVAPAALAKGVFPATIPLPDGFQPEGIAIGEGTTFYVGSIPTGAIYAGDVRTGNGKVRIQGAPGRAATGLKYDRGRLWVSGASTGKAFVYDAKSGKLIREYLLGTGGGSTFVNDVVVTKSAAYFTDSARPVLYRIALSATGAPGAAKTLALGGDYEHVTDAFNLNGIDASANGRTLLAVQSQTGKLYAIDPATGTARTVDLGSLVLANGDGLLLLGKDLYVVQNQLNRIAVLKLAADLRSGKLARTITDPDFDVPTTVGRYGNWLYAVNARFGTATGEDDSYAVVQTRR